MKRTTLSKYRYVLLGIISVALVAVTVFAVISRPEKVEAAGDNSEKGGNARAGGPKSPDSTASLDDPTAEFWQEIPKAQAQSFGRQVEIRARYFRSLTLNRDAMQSQLAAAPQEFTDAAREDTFILSLPSPDGGFQRFAVRESSVMEPELAAKHPDIRTYSGTGIDDPAATIRFDQTPLGFHASVRGPSGSWYIDPYYHLDQSVYVSYFRAALEDSHGTFVERSTDDASIAADHSFYGPDSDVILKGSGFDAGQTLVVTVSEQEAKSSARKLAVRSDANGYFEFKFPAGFGSTHGAFDIVVTDGTKQASTTFEIVSGDSSESRVAVGDQLRTYRLALLTDPSYATYFGGSANVTAAKVTLINRVTQIYEYDLSMRLTLIGSNDLLNLDTAAAMTTANGPCGGAACYTVTQAASCTSSTLTRTRQVIGLIVGAGAFDIGHIGLGVAGGGVASLGVVGGNNKAQGCTGVPTPVGDLFAVDYVAHEMGHQFSGNHPFNGIKTNCSAGNRNAATSVEPGSGSSIMAYAGICSTDNLQPHSDPYFSDRSFDEATTFTAGAETNINEVQMGVLTGYNTNGQSYQIRYNGNDSAAIVRGTNNTAVGIKSAIEAISGWPAGGTVTVSALSDTAFTITFAGTLAGANVSPLSMVNFTGGSSGYASEIATGGATNHRGTVSSTGNTAPTASAPTQFTIPLRTPFALTGIGFDADNDTLTYMWEQNDRGSANGTDLLSNTKADGPLFRQFGVAANVTASDTILYNSPGENPVTTDPTRVFPDMNQILNNNTNALTGGCTNLTDVICFSEFLPTIDYVGFAGTNAAPRSLHFRVTVRDGRGGVNHADTTLLIDSTAGPLLVTSQSSAVSYPGTSVQTVTWDVNNTATALLAPNVKISLSSDGGLTYPYVLVASTPNDGTEDVTIPTLSTTTARLKVEAVGNVFFDVNDSNFTITTPPAPSVTKSFSPATIAVGGASTLTIGFSNPNAVGLSGLAISDAFPAGMEVDGSSNATNTCGGTFTPVAGDTNISISNGSLAANGSCSISVSVTATSNGTKTNTTGNVSTTESGNGSTATAGLSVYGPPTVSKFFVNPLQGNSNNTALNSTARLSIAITNPPTNPGSLTGIAISDTFPTGMEVAASPSSTNTCGGTFVPVAGATSIGFSGGGPLTVGNQCVISVVVKATAAGALVNTTGNVSSNEGGTGGTVSGTLNVFAPNLSIVKSHTVTFTQGSAAAWKLQVTNNSAGAAGATDGSTVTVTDALPIGWTIQSIISGADWNCNLSTSTDLLCTATSVVAGAGGTWSQITVNVAVPGTAAVSTSNTGKVFGGGDPAHINAGTAATSTDTVTVIQTPATVQLSSGNNQSAPINSAFPTVLSATVTDAASVVISGATVTFTAPASGASGKFANNTNTTTAVTNASGVATASVFTSNNVAGTYNVSATSGTATSNFSETNIAPPTVSKSFSPNSIMSGGTSTLTITLTNANAGTDLTGAALVDTLPSGVTTVPGTVATTCPAEGFSQTLNTVGLTGATIPHSGNCALTVDVTASASGVYPNTIAVGGLTTANGGSNVASASANLTVVGAPTLSKAFIGTSSIATSGATESGNTVTIATTSPHGFAAGQSVTISGVIVSGYNGTFTIATVPTASSFTYTNPTAGLPTATGGTATSIRVSVPLNGTANLVFTMANGNTTTSLTGLSFTDVLPAGLSVADGGPTNACGGTFTTTAATRTIAFSGGTLSSSPPTNTCTFNVTVTGAAAGSQVNTTGNITSTQSGPGGTATATLNVIAPPVIGKAFSPASVSIGGNSLMTITLTNPAANTVALTGVGFFDTFPTGMVIAGTPVLNNTCGGSTTGGTAGANNVNLSGGNIPVGGSCTVSVNVTATAQGPLLNQTSIVTSTNGGSGNIGSASLQTRTAVLAVRKTHALPFVQSGNGTWTIQVRNNGTTAADSTTGTTTMVDVLPAGYTLAGYTGTNWICTGTTTVTCTTTAVIAGGGVNFPPITLNVNVPANSPVSITNTAKVFGGGDTTHTSLATAAADSDNVTVGQNAASMTIVGGNNQSTLVNTQFATNLSVIVRDSGNAPMPGADVIFTAPASGQSGSFPGPVQSLTVYADANGIATAPVFTANGISGTYAVSADIGIYHQSFTMTNLPGPVTGHPRADFDGDGKTDISVFRPSDGRWYVNGSSSGFMSIPWGISTDTIVPGDFDGDGKADFAIYRPSNSVTEYDLFVLNSNGYTFTPYDWGLIGDIPISGDYNGDGITEVTIFRPSTSTWWIRNRELHTVQAFEFGASGDIPMAMDFDGDGKTDLAVYRPSDRTWYMAQASGTPAQNFVAMQFGLAGDVLVPGDYDGDNKDDIAVFRPSNGTWYILRSSLGLTQVQFGSSGDIAVPGDYDGDGKDDIAVYRPSSGVWFLNRSTDGFAAQKFGISTDTPVPAAYHP